MDRWSHVDRLLALAYTVIKKTTCSGCGHSLIRTANDDSLGELEVHYMHCNACEQLEREREINKNPPMADKAYLVDTGNQ